MAIFGSKGSNSNQTFEKKSIVKTVENDAREVSDNLKPLLFISKEAEKVGADCGSFEINNYFDFALKQKKLLRREAFKPLWC